MDIDRAFTEYSAKNGAARAMARRTSLALRRGGIDSLEKLRGIYTDCPETLLRLRDIGPGAMAFIGKVLTFYGPGPESGK